MPRNVCSSRHQGEGKWIRRGVNNLGARPDRHSPAQKHDESRPVTLGDLWFDMDGDAYAPGPAGLEYMFGFGFMGTSGFMFDTFEAHDASTERRAFEFFIDEVLQRWAEYPGMHVYHYADYERRTLQRLEQQYGTREIEVDRILQAGILIDLYAVVRQAMRFSTVSLSLKYIEGVYDVSRSGEYVAMQEFDDMRDDGWVAFAGFSTKGPQTELLRGRIRDWTTEILDADEAGELLSLIDMDDYDEDEEHDE